MVISLQIAISGSTPVLGNVDGDKTLNNLGLFNSSYGGQVHSISSLAYPSQKTENEILHLSLCTGSVYEHLGG